MANRTAGPLDNPLSIRLIDSDPEGFAARLGSDIEQYGFATVRDHGIAPDIMSRADQAIRAFFQLPSDEKARYRLPGQGGARGYTPFGIETAKGAVHHDLKEFWHVGREIAAEHAYRLSMPPNVWPTEVLGFQPDIYALFAALDTVGLTLLRSLAIYLKVDPGVFDDAVRDGNSILRLLHYPPVREAQGHVRAGAHEDINVITLLLGAEEAGLEILTRDGAWLPVNPPPGAMVVNVGDMLQRLTNNVLPSTTHRVVNPAPDRFGFSRYSTPFFLHFRPDFLIETLPCCVSDRRPNQYPQPITADAFLQQRLAEIKLK